MRLKQHAPAALAYAALTVLMTWPLPARLDLIEAGDSSYFAWAIAWTTHALTSDPASLPHANTLHPLRYTLFLDEPIVGTTILSLPLRLFTDDPILILNATRLVLFFATALGTRALALSIGLGPFAAFAAGAFFSFASNRVTSPAHLSVLGTQFVPLYLLFLHRWARDGRARDAALAGTFFGLSAWACGYHALLAIAILPLPILVLLDRTSPLRTAIFGIAPALAFLVPLRSLHQQALAPLGYERTVSETAFFSAPLEALFATASSNRIWGGVTEPLRTIVEANLFPGVAAFALAALATWHGLRDPVRRRTTAVYLSLALCALGVALGPEIQAFGKTIAPGPFALLREIELFRMIRVPARASMFFTLAISMLAAMALDRVRRPALQTALLVVALAEAAAFPLDVVAAERCIRTSERVTPVDAWIAAEPGREAILELPILPNDGLFQRPRFDDSVYLLRSTAHFKPLVNGYAGTEPPFYAELREAMREFPSEAAMTRVRALGVRRIVVHLKALGPNRRQAFEERLPAFASSLEEKARFGDDLVLEVKPQETGAPSANVTR